MTLAQTFTSTANVAEYWPALAARADGTVADYSRGVGTQAVVVPVDADRNEPDCTGHFVRELTRDA